MISNPIRYAPVVKGFNDEEIVRYQDICIKQEDAEDCAREHRHNGGKVLRVAKFNLVEMEDGKVLQSPLDTPIYHHKPVAGTANFDYPIQTK